MLAGVSGHLVSTAFLERSVLRDRGDDRLTAARRALVAWRSRCQLGPASSTRTLLESGVELFSVLGFDARSDVEQNGRLLVATLRRGGHNVALLVSPYGERFDPLWRIGIAEAVSRSAAWAVFFDGQRLRIVDAGRLYARRFIEFDLDLALDSAACFDALWSAGSAAALASHSRDAHSLHDIIRASDRHASGVCRSLRDGVVAASSDVLTALVAGDRKRRFEIGADSFEQALTIVYRLLFLLFAEARALVPLWHPIYRESYSVEALRDLAERTTRTPGMWDALRAMSRLAHNGCRAGDLRVTPFNGRLFAPARTPLADRRGLDDEAARRAVLALSTRSAPDRAGRERIEYRDLGVEQLGAVYETLLDYQPRSTSAARSGTVVTLEPGSGIRKATGTFYTPQPIADYLVRRTLGPLTGDAPSHRILQLRVVDPAMGSGAFLVAACRYLAHAYEQALIREGRHPGDFDETERVAIRRTIAERCLYGVDVNPMAVQLARLSLWLATLAADRPLSFLDHRLQVGDSLLGVWLTNLRRRPEPRRRVQPMGERPLFDDDAVGAALRETMPSRFSLELTPNDTLEHVRNKERLYAAITAHGSAISRWKRLAHLWCASWFAPDGHPAPPSAFGSLTDYVLHGRGALPEATARRYVDAGEAAARSRRLFHWELEYPEVFFDDAGHRLDLAGFDAVIGNPPWDMIRADAGSADARVRARDDVARVVRFTRDAGIYAAQSDGHANRYQLFVERAIALTKRGGRIGLVLPSGLATDQGSASLRRLLFSTCDVDAIVGIDNHRGVFPIHRSVRFLLVTASAGRSSTTISCRLDLSDPADLESLGDEPAEHSAWFPVRLTRPTLEHISGSDLVLPALRTSVDLTIVERAASLFPPLGSAHGFRARFGRELNITDDRGALSAIRDGTPGRRQKALLPVVEGKHLEPFHVSLDAVRYVIRATDAHRLLPDGRWHRPRLAYRDVASPTNRLTLIAAVLPSACVSTHTVFCLRTPTDVRTNWFLCGLFNTFVLNYLVRLRVSTHVTTAIVERLPVPTRESAPAAFAEIAAMARLLSRGPDPSTLARLNATAAALYQLTVAEFEHILATFPLVEETERRRALAALVSAR